MVRSVSTVRRQLSPASILGLPLEENDDAGDDVARQDGQALVQFHGCGGFDVGVEESAARGGRNGLRRFDVGGRRRVAGIELLQAAVGERQDPALGERRPFSAARDL